MDPEVVELLRKKEELMRLLAEEGLAGNGALQNDSTNSMSSEDDYEDDLDIEEEALPITPGKKRRRMDDSLYEDCYNGSDALSSETVNERGIEDTSSRCRREEPQLSGANMTEKDGCNSVINNKEQRINSDIDKVVVAPSHSSSVNYENGRDSGDIYADSMDVDNVDVEDLLEAPVDQQKEANNDNKIWKNVLERMENDHFETLPEGWTRVTHNSGMPLYLHRDSRVVSLTRPYFIGGGSVRHHNVPLTAVPCLHQKRLDEREELDKAARATQEKDLANLGKSNSSTANPTAALQAELLQKLNAPAVKIERQEDYQLTPDEYHEYAKRLFKFKRIQVTRYANYHEKQQARREKKFEESLKESGLNCSVKDLIEKKAPPGIALIHIPTADNRFHKKSFVMNPQGKTSVTILHEYTQRALRGHMNYDIEETRSVTCPYKAVAVLIMKKAIRVQVAGTMKEKLALLQGKETCERKGKDDEDSIIVGRGEGASKKIAKMAAAKMALEVLIPEIHFNEEYTASILPADTSEKNYDDQAIELFDQLPIEDPRVNDMCTKTGQPKPLALLKNALNRSIKWCGRQPTQKIDVVGPQRTRVTMTVGDISCTVESTGGKTGKQRAAQGLLKQMHPELDTYGSLLRLYASSTEKAGRRDARRHHNEVVRLQNKGSLLQPNHAVISKLKAEMLKLAMLQPTRPPLSATRPPVRDN